MTFMLSSKACQPPCSHTVPHFTQASHAPSWKAHLDSADAIQQRWLSDTGSLTRRLTQVADGNFQVTPINEGWAMLRDDECAALGLPLGVTGWVREVQLKGNGRPWVFARSVAGQQALVQDGFPIEALGTRSLGELLFVDGGFSRGPLEACHYPPAWVPGLLLEAAPLARRSRFERGTLGLLVTEVFLPEFWATLPDPKETC
jgi:chorismate--pyruvate lyase